MMLLSALHVADGALALLGLLVNRFSVGSAEETSGTLQEPLLQ